MPIPAGTAVFALLFVVFALALLFTRLWMDDIAARAVRDLHVLGMRPGRNYKLGGAWTRAAARDPRNLLWAALALTAWIALLISLDVVRR